MVLELGRQVSRFRRFMLRHPRKAIILLPFSFKSFTIARSCPKLRLFQVNGVNTCINYFLYQRFEIGDISIRRNGIGYIPPMPDAIAFPVHLSFVEMRFAIKLTGKIILVIAPGYTGHKLNVISMLLPSFHRLLKGTVKAIHNSYI